MREGRLREEWTIRKNIYIYIVIKEWGICRNPDMKKTKKKNVGRSGRGRVVLMVSVTLTAACHLVIKPSLHSTLVKDTAYREITDDQF